jgi:hypothetical protein
MYKEIINLFDTAVSFFGIANMLDLSADGIKEAKRVLKVGQSLLDTYVIIKEDSEGFKLLKEFCKQNKVDGAEKFAIKTGIEKTYFEANFDRKTIVTIGESIGEKSDFDLLPLYIKKEGLYSSFTLLSSILFSLISSTLVIR